MDSRAKTIEQDPEYLAFVESLKDPAAASGKGINANYSIDILEKNLMLQQQQHLLQQQSDALGASASAKSTPLLEELRAKKAALRASLEKNKQINVAKQKAAAAARSGRSSPTVPKKSEKEKGKASVGASEKLKSEIVKNLPETVNKEGKRRERKKTKDSAKNPSVENLRKSDGLDVDKEKDTSLEPADTTTGASGGTTVSRNHSSKKRGGRGAEKRSGDSNKKAEDGRGDEFERSKNRGPRRRDSATTVAPGAGPRVMIMKRDGTTTSFKVGDEN